MDYPNLYRKRLIPDECILLKNDNIISATNQVIITKWNALKPKPDLDHGYSCYFLKEGYKVSKFYRKDGSLLYWYCDIVDYEYKESTNSLIVTDLLADVIIYPDGFVKVVDLEELVVALDSGLISLEQLKLAIIRMNNLLSVIYAGQFDSLKKFIETLE